MKRAMNRDLTPWTRPGTQHQQHDAQAQRAIAARTALSGQLAELFEVDQDTGFVLCLTVIVGFMRAGCELPIDETGYLVRPPGGGDAVRVTDLVRAVHAKNLFGSYFAPWSDDQFGSPELEQLQRAVMRELVSRADAQGRSSP